MAEGDKCPRCGLELRHSYPGSAYLKCPIDHFFWARLRCQEPDCVAEAYHWHDHGHFCEEHDREDR